MGLTNHWKHKCTPQTTQHLPHRCDHTQPAWDPLLEKQNQEWVAVCVQTGRLRRAAYRLMFRLRSSAGTAHRDPSGVPSLFRKTFCISEVPSITEVCVTM